MICIIALIVFAILAIFSAKYRPLAAEAFDCVFRRVTLRPCRSGLDKRLKSQITGTLMRKNKRAGRFVYRYFEYFSWALLILLILSIIQTGISVYNYIEYGNCNGPDETGFCIFDPTGANAHQISEAEICLPDGANQATDELVAPNISELEGNPRTGSASAPITIIEFGCFACPNTAKQAPAVKKLIEHYGTDIQFIYVDFPLPNHAFSEEAAEAADCVLEQDPIMYWKYHFLIFEEQEQLSNESLKEWALALGADEEAYDACMADPTTLLEVNKDAQIGAKAGVYGTPTFFINGESLVGVKSYNLLRARIDALLEP